MRKAAIPGRVKIGERIMTAPNLTNIDKLISSRADRFLAMGPSTDSKVSTNFAQGGSIKRTCLHVLSASGNDASGRSRIEPPECRTKY